MLHLLVVLLGASLLSFSLVELLPGDAAVAILGEQASEQQLQSLREELGLDQPLPQRYLQWLVGALRGDLGRSHRSGEPVMRTLAERLPVSVQLMLLSQVLALGAAIPLALASARRPGGRVDRLVAVVSLAALSMPAYVYAIVLIFVFALGLGWLPATGYVAMSESVTGNLRSLLLPAITLALVETPLYLRVLRHDLANALSAPHIRTLRANGIPEHSLLCKYAFKPASFTLITLLGLNAGNLIAGAVLVETIFALPGMGRLLVQALYARDIMVIQGAVLTAAVAFVAINLLVDAAGEALDPRRRGEPA